MTDRNKVIKALEICATGTGSCEKCPYRDECKGVANAAMAHAIERLKAQEPVEPYIKTSQSGTSWWYSCGNCNRAVDPNDKYCRNCGRKMKWDG